MVTLDLCAADVMINFADFSTFVSQALSCKEQKLVHPRSQEKLIWNQTSHPIEKEHHLPNLHVWGSKCKNFSRVQRANFPDFIWVIFR